MPEPQTMRGRSAWEGYIGKEAAAPKMLGQRGAAGRTPFLVWGRWG